MFGGFRASLNIFGGKKNKKDLTELSSDLNVTGAYRKNREDTFGFNSILDTSTKPNVQPTSVNKNVNFVDKSDIAVPDVRNSNEVSSDPRGAEQADYRYVPPLLSLKDLKQQGIEQRNLEKRRSVERLAKEKQQENRKQEIKSAKENDRKIRQNQEVERVKEKIQREKENERKLREEQAKLKRDKDERKMREKQEQERIKEEKSKNDKERKLKEKQEEEKVKREKDKKVAKKREQKRMAPQPSPSIISSISKSSGPPPYSEREPVIDKIDPNKFDGYRSNISGNNVTFSKPIDTGSWDMISKHREQINKPVNAPPRNRKQAKQLVMDLNYNFDAPSSSNQQNSEA